MNEVVKSAAKEDESWLSVPERGAVFGIWFFAAAAVVAGRTIPRIILLGVVAYYYVVSRRARRAIKDFHLRLRGKAPTLREGYTHLLRFAQVALDRLFFATGKFDKFRFETNGDELLAEAAREPRGSILIGAHLGSFAAMRAGAQDEDLQINAVAYQSNSRVINGVLEKLDPDSNVNIIDISKDRVAGVLRMRECIERGEFVALLADRVGVNDKWVEVDFLGATARFPTGGFLLASLLRCKVFLVFGLYRGGNEYELHCEPFRDQVSLPRGEREPALQALAQDYANRLEHYCRKAPDNWFNFYDFWSSK